MPDVTGKELYIYIYIQSNVKYVIEIVYHPKLLIYTYKIVINYMFWFHTHGKYTYPHICRPYKHMYARCRSKESAAYRNLFHYPLQNSSISSMIYPSVARIKRQNTRYDADGNSSQPWITKDCYNPLLTKALDHWGKQLSLLIHLTPWNLNKMAAIFADGISRSIFSMKFDVFSLNFHWNLFLRFPLAIGQHWFRW